MRIDDAPPPLFDPNEEVMLCPTVFKAICENFGITSVIDLFASTQHHQLPRYFSVDADDQQAEGCNAFNFRWDSSQVLYANPTWSMLDQVVDKVINPRWPDEGWYKKLKKIRTDRQFWRQPLYLGQEVELRRAPKWTTVFTWISPGSL